MLLTSRSYFAHSLMIWEHGFSMCEPWRWFKYKHLKGSLHKRYGIFGGNFSFHGDCHGHSSIRSYSPLGTGAGALWPPEPRCRIAPQKSASSKWCRWGEGDARWGKWGGPIDQPPFLATGTQNQAGPDCHDTRWGIWGGPLLPASFSGHRHPPPCPGTECELFFIIFGWNNPHFGYFRASLSV